jgi:hypothetical protein
MISLRFPYELFRNLLMMRYVTYTTRIYNSEKHSEL